MTPVSQVLRREALRFFELQSLDGNSPAAVNARTALCLALHSYGWSQSRIAARVGLTRWGVASAIARGKETLRGGSNRELQAAVHYLAQFIPQ